ncbi:MFS transporter [Candidatus Woesearchaeota archaeon]|nr:MFS transporter [Candidatus Woesearchaeota archaeon]
MLKFPKIILPLKGVNYLIFIVLVNSIASSMLVPIFPLYIKNFVSNNAVVGYISVFIAALLILYTLLTMKLLPRIKKMTLIKVGFLGLAITQIIFTVLVNIEQFLILEIVRALFLVATYLTMGLFVREYTSTKAMGRAEGQYFTIANLGFLLGPLLGGLLANAYSFNVVFIVSAIPQILIAALLFLIPLKESETQHKHKLGILDYFKNKSLLMLYLLALGLFAWWSILYTYLPLYANTSGFSAKIIGYALFAAAIPLILLEIPIGKLADSHGFRKYIALGFIIIGLVMLLTYFAKPFYVLILIAAATIGAAFIEPLLEAYFFKNVKTKEDEHKLYPVYKTSAHLSSLIAPLIFSTILIYFNFKGLFLFVAILMLIFSLLALKLKK